MLNNGILTPIFFVDVLSNVTKSHIGFEGILKSNRSIHAWVGQTCSKSLAPLVTFHAYISSWAADFELGCSKFDEYS
jgi:hypothetical protein